MEKLVSVNTALLARELGFEIHCDWRFDEENNNELINWKDFRVRQCIEYDRSYSYKAIEYLENDYYDTFDNKEIGYYLAAPTQSVLQKWLREVYGFENIYIIKSNKGWHYSLSLLIENISWKVFETYEEALEAILYECLTSLKKDLVNKLV